MYLRRPFAVKPDGRWPTEAKRLLPSRQEASLQLEVVEHYIIL